VAYQRHCDLGEIRTRKLSGLTPPEKKERLGTRERNENALVNSKASITNLLVFSFSKDQYSERILKYEFCASKINIDFRWFIVKMQYPEEI
jgi:hypothetical protein